MHLSAKLIISVKDDIESIPDKIPLSENTLILPSEYDENISTKLENDILILLPKIFLPREQMKVVMSDVAPIIDVQISIEKFMKIDTNNNLKQNLCGVSTPSPE